MRSLMAMALAWIVVLAPAGIPEGWNARAEAQSTGPGSAPAATVETLGTDWTLTVEPNATVQICHKGAPVIRVFYRFWGTNWTFAGGGALQAESRGEDSFVVQGPVAGLKIDVSGTIRSPAPNRLEMDLGFNALVASSGVVGGGFDWEIQQDSASFGGRLPDPELLDDRTGWRWAVGRGQLITARLDRPFATISTQRNRRGQVFRTFLYANQVPAGLRRIHLVVTLPEGGRRVPSTTERYGAADTRSWFRDAMAPDKAPLDLRFLNRGDRPAGRRGFVRADGDRLVFADGTPARFWASVVGGDAIYRTPREIIPLQARRIAQLGFNLIRLNHHETMLLGLRDPRSTDSRHFVPEAWDRLDWWFKCLKDEGIYLWLDLRGSRRLKPGDGVTQGRDEILREKGKFEGFHYYNRQLHDLMVEFQHVYLNHVNPYTGLAYKDDPAVAFVLLTNEDDLTQHNGNLMLGNKNHPVHHALFQASTQAFARAHGLPLQRVVETWLPGPSKRYLNEIEHQFNRAMIADLKSLGVKAPIVTTNYWGFSSMFTLPALTDGDVIDVHSYGTREALSDNPRYVSNYISFITAAHVYGKPLSVSEWNVLYDTAQSFRVTYQVDRFTAPLYMASIAALQGWDMAMLYIYSQIRLPDPARPEVWSSFYDPGLTGVMPAAALAYRQGHISPARATYCLAIEPDPLFNRPLNADTSATIRTLTEQSRLTIGLPAVKELPWLKPSHPAADVTVVTDPDRDFIPPGQSFVRSDTGELTRDWESGIQTIDTPRTQAVSGWIGGRALETRDATFRFATRKAVVALSSVDNRPLATSRFILITTVARVVPSPGDTFPLLSEPVTGTITLATAVEGLQLRVLGPDGRVVGRSTPPRAGDRRTITLPAGRGTHWFVLKADGPAPPGADLPGDRPDSPE